ARGVEWYPVYILNVVDGSFPSEFSTGKAELIEEERRLLYVAMTRARNELTCVVPLRFQITSQPKTSDGHVYGARSRFLTEKVVKCFDEQTFQGTNAEVKIDDAAAESGTIDVASRLKQMWGTTLPEFQGKAIALANRFELLPITGSLAQRRRQRPDALFVILGVFRVRIDLRSIHQFESRGLDQLDRVVLVHVAIAGALVARLGGIGTVLHYT